MNERRKYTHRVKYSKELLTPLVKEARTTADVMRSLELSPSGNTFSYVSKRIKEFGIDTSHFLTRSQYSALGKQVHKKSAAEILQKRDPSDRKIPGYLLRRALLELGREYKCEVCSLPQVWNGEPLVIQVDHINGQYWDNDPRNLRFICPNCHTQTSTFCSRNKAIKRELKRCDDCMKTISTGAKYCKTCFLKRRTAKTKGVPNTRARKVEWPPKSVLENLLATTPMTRIAEKFGVSDNSVKKWAIKYGIFYSKPKKEKRVPVPKFLREVINGKVWCSAGKHMAPIEDFTKDKNNRLGLHECCRNCRKTQKGRSKKIGESTDQGIGTDC